jgi:hypothetical protein
MTAAQQRILDEVRTSGRRIYNGRARRPIRALENAGLVQVEYDQVAQSKGSGIELVERFVVTPTTSKEA